MQFTPLGPWGVGASAGPATEGLKGLSGRVANPIPLRGNRVGKGLSAEAKAATAADRPVGRRRGHHSGVGKVMRARPMS